MPYTKEEEDAIEHLKKFVEAIEAVCDIDVRELAEAQNDYGDSWKRRGGVGAFMMLARKWDRLEKQISRKTASSDPYDIFSHIHNDSRSEGIIDDIRDLRRYLLLVEAEIIQQGFDK